MGEVLLVNEKQLMAPKLFTKLSQVGVTARATNIRTALSSVCQVMLTCYDLQLAFPLPSTRPNFNTRKGQLSGAGNTEKHEVSFFTSNLRETQWQPEIYL